MKHWLIGALAIAGLWAAVPTAAADDGTEPAQMQEKAGSRNRRTTKGPSDAQIRKLLIEESIAAYSGNCPCPYSRARNGSRCGRRSAYDREGGAAPLCFAKDVSAEMVQQYRAENP